MTKWHEYSDKYLSISPREQYLIFFTGLVAIVYIFFNVFIDKNIAQSAQYDKEIKQLMSVNKTKKSSIEIYEQALTKDPNVKLKNQVDAYENKLEKIDSNLLALTSELIDPVQMRFALLELLKTQKGVSLLSFQLVGAQPLKMPTNESEEDKTPSSLEKNSDDIEQVELRLYRHGIKLKLRGSYFQLRDYLTQLEDMSWKFFWKKFDYKLHQYPVSELEIEIYSLSTNQEFIGV